MSVPPARPCNSATARLYESPSSPATAALEILKNVGKQFTVGARILNAFGIRMVESRSNGGWFGLRQPFKYRTISSVVEWFRKLFDRFRVGHFISMKMLFT